MILKISPSRQIVSFCNTKKYHSLKTSVNPGFIQYYNIDLTNKTIISEFKRSKKSINIEHKIILCLIYSLKL
jgi:hypothetical protein